MRIRLRRSAVLLGALPLVVAATALMAGNDVPQSSAGQLSMAVTVPVLKASTNGKVDTAQATAPQHYYHFLNVAATLTFAGVPVVGQTITFTADTSAPGSGVVCVATTNIHGRAHCSNNTKVETGQFSGTPTQFFAVFGGTSAELPVTAIGTLKTVG